VLAGTHFLPLQYPGALQAELQRLAPAAAAHAGRRSRT
jgi:hypothetical protein